MNRPLAALVVVQFLVIIALVVLHFGGEDDRSLDTRPDAPRVADGAEIGAEPRRRNDPGTDLPQAAPDLSASALDDSAVAAAFTGVVLFGALRNREGEDVEGTIILTDSAGTHVMTSAQDGSYARAGLPFGRWHLEVKANDHRPYEADIDLGAEPQYRLDIVLEKAVVLPIIVLTPDGEPLRPKLREFGHWMTLIAVATEGAPLGNLPMTPYRYQYRWGVGEFKGENEFPNRRSQSDQLEGSIGDLELRGELPAQVSLILRHVVIATQLVPVGADRVVFELSPEELRRHLASFRVKLVDAATGAGISDARVALNDRQTMTSGQRTDDDGLCVIEDLRPGIFLLGISAPGFGGRSEYVALEPGKTLDLGTLKLVKPGRVKGRIVGRDGEPRSASIEVRCLDNMATPQLLSTGARRQSEADGSYALEGLAAGRHLVLVRTEDGAKAHRVVSVSPDQETTLDIALAETASVRIISQVGRGDFLLVRIVDDQGLPIYADYYSGDWNRSFTLPLGAHRLEIYRDVELLQSRDFSVSADGVVLTVP